MLPSHAQAAAQGVGRAPREPNVPAYWPGTYVPNLSDWKPGDIVLVEAAGLGGGLIQLAQTITAKPLMGLGSQWSHAAIYIGQGMVVDATFGAGVQQQSVWNYCQLRAITLRRIDDPSIPAADIANIAMYAQLHVGQSYSALQALLGKLGWPASAKTPNPNAVYCSTFAGLVVAEATTINLAAHPSCQPLYPAVLAMHPDLDAVPLGWRNI